MSLGRYIIDWQAVFACWHLAAGRDVEILNFLDEYSRLLLLIDNGAVSPPIHASQGGPRIRARAPRRRRPDVGQLRRVGRPPSPRPTPSPRL